MPAIDPDVDYAAKRLGGRTLPDDLHKLLTLRRSAAASGSIEPLKEAGVTFLDGDRMPDLIAAVRAGRDDWGGLTRLAHAQAMEDMVRYSGFVAEDAAGGAIGYWFSPEHIPIGAAPLMRFDTDGNFSILSVDGIAEAILVIASRGDNARFLELRDDLNEHGLNITARTIEDVHRRECLVAPQATYQQLIQAHSTELSTTSVPDTGDPVDIMTTHRGPEIGPSGER